MRVINSCMARKRRGGHKPLNGKPVIRSFSLTRRHLAAIERWKAAHECANVSEALRQIIDAATKGGVTR